MSGPSVIMLYGLPKSTSGRLSPDQPAHSFDFGGASVSFAWLRATIQLLIA